MHPLHMHHNGVNSTNAAFEYDFIVGKNVRRSLSIIHGCSVGSFSYKSVGFFTVEPDIVLVHSYYVHFMHRTDRSRINSNWLTTSMSKVRSECVIGVQKRNCVKWNNCMRIVSVISAIYGLLRILIHIHALISMNMNV